ncbi:tetratricopeptide repeat protein 12 [Boleophthalmus pectinirostris]|uniref:tetratricopeptide repeat protein 12 n=1 Tax=Boleophthalmus pectinirostris TaxID=150288 RepID=UPI00242ECD74|nr:tetratricopeptide repeat protein 12 [Boleophthalmus pectinirostris]
MDHLQDIESFLNNVDKISELVQNLNSTDTGIQQKAIEEADRHIAASREPCKTTFSHITINPVPPLQAPTSATQDQSPENFMKTIEKDAEDREKKRTEKEKRATALKDRGNKAFAQEDYETAVKYYSEGLVELKDMQVLYTNRALAYMKLSKYKEAICDCEWALKCNEKCIKAYLHMGKAYQALKNYNESRKCFEKIVEFEPARKDMIKGYLLQLDLDEKRDVQENSARQDFDMRESKAIAVSQLLEKLSRSGHGLVWYCEALKCLTHTVTNSTAQTLFRLNNGFSIINDNDIVKSCLLKGYTDPLSQELCVTVLKLWQTICSENDENQKTLMACPVFRKSIAEYLLSDDGAVQKECLSLLLLYSQTPRGRQLAVDNLDVQMLAKNLMACFSKPGQQQEDTAVNILENFASENRFCCLLRPGLVEAVMTPFTTILTNINKSHQPVLPALLSAISCLARDDIIRHKLSHDLDCWKAFLVAIKEYTAFEYKGILYPLLGLMINLSAHPSPAVQELAVSICDSCLGMLTDSDGEVVMRATGVLSHVLLQSSEAVQCAVQRGVVRNMLLILKGTGQTATKYAIRTLTVCTAANQLAREELVKADKRLSILRHLLESSCDEVVCGNAALCVAHCLELAGIASNLLGTDVVLLLLRHAAADTKTTAVQKNAAIALGKLCRSEPRHMHKLRELHGLEILHSCTKLLA